MREPPVPLQYARAVRHGLYRQLALGTGADRAAGLGARRCSPSSPQRHQPAVQQAKSGLGELLREDRAALRFLLCSILTAVPVAHGPPRPGPGADTGQRLPILRYRWQAPAAARPDRHLPHVRYAVMGGDGQRSSDIDTGFAKSQIASVSKPFLA